MSHVKYETATRLKDAGFPQPKPAPGQLWYKTIFEGGTAQHIAPCVLLDFGGQIVMQAIAPRWDYPGNSGFDKKAVFAPDAADILKLLPSDNRASFMHDAFWVEWDGGILHQTALYGSDLAEVLAERYLKLNPA